LVKLIEIGGKLSSSVSWQVWYIRARPEGTYIVQYPTH